MEKGDKKDWANMSDDEDAEREVQKEQVPQEEKKKVPKPMKGVKNDRGDYVVTTIDVAETRAPEKKSKEVVEEESDSDEGYGEEEDNQQEEVKEEVKAEAKPGK